MKRKNFPQKYGKFKLEPYELENACRFSHHKEFNHIKKRFNC